MSGGELAERIARAGLRPPRSVTIAITGACNLRCSHCWVDAGAPSSVGHAPEGALLRVVDAFVALGVEAIWITGGEPLSHPAWPRILSRCCEDPRVRAVGLQTNGTLLDAARIARLRALSRGKVHVEVSLDGASSRTHDRVRGPGAFAEAIAGLARLVGAGLADRTAIAFTEMRDNVQDIPRLLEIADGLRIRRVVGGTLVRGGSAVRNGLQPPTPAQYRALLALYRADPRFRDLYDRVGTFCAVEWWKGRSQARGEPCEFVGHPYVSADGKTYPCRLCHADEFAAVGAFERPLGAVLGEAIPRWRELLRRALARPAHLSACRGCPAERQCAGGCMGRALASCGSLDATDDRCALRKAVQLEGADRDGDGPPRRHRASGAA